MNHRNMAGYPVSHRATQLIESLSNADKGTKTIGINPMNNHTEKTDQNAKSRSETERNIY